MPFPKILIIGQPFNNNTGGGITLSNLFSGWDKDKIAVTCTGYLLSDNIDPKICNTYYQLGFKEHKWAFPFNLIKRKYPSGLVKFEKNNTHKLSIAKSKLRVKLLMDFFYPFLKYLGLYHVILRTELSKDFCDWINDYKPDVVYAQATSRDAVLFCIKVHDYTQKPLIFHVMDDWPALIGNKGLFKKYWHNKIDHEFRILLEKADFLMSISDQMSNEYMKRYGKVFIPFHNPIDIAFWKKYQRTEYNLGGSPTILYAGRTGLGINSSLEIIAMAIQAINEEINTSLKFILQIEENPSWVNNYSCIECKGFVPYNDLPRVFSEADFLILPYDFSKESIKYVQYSMPTKAPEYMISGTPIIIFAPEVTAIVKYAKEFEWAKIVTVNKVNELSRAIIKLIQDEEERKMFGQNAIRIAETRHNSIKVTEDFKTRVCSL